MFTVNVKEGTVTYRPKAKKPDENHGTSTYYFMTKDDVMTLSGPEIVEIFNTIVKANPEFKVREVNKFSSLGVAQNRLWGMFVRLKAVIESDEEHPRPTREERSPAKSATRLRQKVHNALKDKEVPKSAKTYPIRTGTMQELMFNLVSRKDGIPVDEFIAEMNKKHKAKYSRGNAWSSLVFILHTNKGYGLRLKNERFYLLTK